MTTCETTPSGAMAQTTNTWFEEVMEKLHWRDGRQARRTIRADLRDGLSVKETATPGEPSSGSIQAMGLAGEINHVKLEPQREIAGLRPEGKVRRVG